MQPLKSLVCAGVFAFVLSPLSGVAADQDVHDHSAHAQGAAPATDDGRGLDAVTARLRSLHDRSVTADPAQREGLAGEQDKALQEGMDALARQRRDSAAHAAKMKGDRDSRDKDGAAAADPHAGHAAGAAGTTEAPTHDHGQAAAGDAGAAKDGGHDHGDGADDGKGMKGMKGMMKGMKGKDKEQSGKGMMAMHRAIEQRMDLLEAMLQVMMDRQGGAK